MRWVIRRVTKRESRGREERLWTDNEKKKRRKGEVEVGGWSLEMGEKSDGQVISTTIHSMLLEIL